MTERRLPDTPGTAPARPRARKDGPSPAEKLTGEAFSAIAENGTTAIAVGAQGEIYRSTNSGTSWTQISTVMAYKERSWHLADQRDRHLPGQDNVGYLAKTENPLKMKFSIASLSVTKAESKYLAKHPKSKTMGFVLDFINKAGKTIKEKISVKV